MPSRRSPQPAKPARSDNETNWFTAAIVIILMLAVIAALVYSIWFKAPITDTNNTNAIPTPILEGVLDTLPAQPSIEPNVEPAATPGRRLLFHIET